MRGGEPPISSSVSPALPSQWLVHAPAREMAELLQLLPLTTKTAMQEENAVKGKENMLTFPPQSW